MGKTSVEVKERYNKKSYEDIRVRVKKGQKEVIQAHVQKTGELLRKPCCAIKKKLKNKNHTNQLNP